jgi:hypothetical protein
VAVGLHAPERDLLTVWNRGGTAEAPMIFLPKWKGQKLRIDTVGAGEPLGEGALQWEASEGRLKIAFPDASTPMARTLSISGAGS